MKMENIEDKIVELCKKNYNLELAREGTWLEYQYVTEKKDKYINELKKELDQSNKYYQQEFKKIVQELEKYKKENEEIKNSRWWKLRNKIKGIK